MKLMTKEIEKKLEKYGQTGENEKGFDSEIVVKYFNPLSNQTWLFTEGERIGNDWELYGYVEVFSGIPEWGYTMLSDIENVKLPMGLSLERDLHLKQGTTVVQECERLGIHVPEYYYEEKFMKKCYDLYKEEFSEESLISFEKFCNNDYEDIQFMRMILDEDMLDEWKERNEFSMWDDDIKYPELSECKDFKILLRNLDENELEKIEKTLFQYYNSEDIEVEDTGAGFQVVSKSGQEINSTICAWAEGAIDTKDFIKEVFNKDMKVDKKVLIGIYQLGCGDETFHKRFMGLDYLEKKNEKVNVNKYELIYCTYRKLETYTQQEYIKVCEDLYKELNTQEHPQDYYGYSLSVSDVVVIGDETGKIKACMYCDQYGFQEVFDFFENDKKNAAFKFARQIDVNEEIKMCDVVESGVYNDGFIPEFLLDNDMRKERINDLKEYREIIDYKENSHLDVKIKNAETKKENNKENIPLNKSKNEDRQI